jgi:Protein of unknown function (DUF1579)
MASHSTAMKHTLTAILRHSTAALAAVMLLIFPAVSRTQAPPEMPKPVKEHEWLKQFVGDWEMEGTCDMGPGAEPMKSKGTESARMMGGFWLIAEGKGEAMGMPFTHIMTLGYDVEKRKYIGTWVDSMLGHMWKYEGSVDATGKIITLEAEGPNFMAGGKMTKFRDVMEFKDKDHRVLTSSMLGEDGKWVTFMRGESRRKK